MKMKEKALKYFTYLIFFLVLISCAISISNNGIYKDGEWANVMLSLSEKLKNKS